MILPINHLENWIFRHQRRQAKIEKELIHKNSTRIDHDYRVGDKVMVRRRMNLNIKHHLKFRMIFFKRKQKEQSS